MEPPLRRKIVSNVDGQSLRSNVVTPITTTVKAKVTSNAILGSRNRRSDREGYRSQSPARLVDKSSSVRTTSPITPQFLTKSVSNTRITSPEMPWEKPLVDYRSDDARLSPSVAPRAKASSVIIGKRTSLSRVASPTPSAVTTTTLRSVSSSHSLPSSPFVNEVAQVRSSLKPDAGRRYHYRHGSTSDTSSLSVASPSSFSSTSFIPCDEVLEPRRSRSSSTISSNNTASTRVKSRMSDITLANPVPTSPLSNGALNLLQDRVQHQNTLTHLKSLSSDAPPGVDMEASRSHLLLPAEKPSNTVIHPLHSPRVGAAEASWSISRHYQPFPIPSLPAPPPPSAIPELLSHSPPNRAPSPRASLSSTSNQLSRERGRSNALAAEQTPELGPLRHLRVLGWRENLSQILMYKWKPKREERLHQIADLEITNQSLLAINAMLEETKLRQANEIRELRRRLRETRLTLPPKTFAALRSNEGPGNGLADEDDDSSLEDVSQETDPGFFRLKTMIDHMLGNAKDAVRMDQEFSSRHENVNRDRVPVVKVLSANEAKEYAESSHVTSSLTREYEHGKLADEVEGGGSGFSLYPPLEVEPNSPPSAMLSASLINIQQSSNPDGGKD